MWDFKDDFTVNFFHFIDLTDLLIRLISKKKTILNCFFLVLQEDTSCEEGKGQRQEVAWWQIEQTAYKRKHWCKNMSEKDKMHS